VESVGHDLGARGQRCRPATTQDIENDYILVARVCSGTHPPLHFRRILEASRRSRKIGSVREDGVFKTPKTDKQYPLTNLLPRREWNQLAGSAPYLGPTARGDLRRIAPDRLAFVRSSPSRAPGRVVQEPGSL